MKNPYPQLSPSCTALLHTHIHSPMAVSEFPMPIKKGTLAQT